MMAIIMFFVLLFLLGTILFILCDSIIQNWKSWRSTIKYKRTLKEIELEYEEKRLRRLERKKRE